MTYTNEHKSGARGYFWDVRDVMSELGISRPTAYKLMHESGAMVRTPRRCRVFTPDFIKFLRLRGGEND